MNINVARIIKDIVDGQKRDIYVIDREHYEELLKNGFFIRSRINNNDGTTTITISNNDYNFVYFIAN